MWPAYLNNCILLASALQFSTKLSNHPLQELLNQSESAIFARHNPIIIRQTSHIQTQNKQIFEALINKQALIETPISIY